MSTFYKGNKLHPSLAYMHMSKGADLLYSNIHILQ